MGAKIGFIMERPDRSSDRRRRQRMVRDAINPQQPSALLRDLFSTIPRHWFVPEFVAAAAYDDRPLSIGSAQTISQPRLVARMLSLLEVQAGDMVLDVGAGSGYVSTLLAGLTGPHGHGFCH